MKGAAVAKKKTAKAAKRTAKAKKAKPKSSAKKFKYKKNEPRVKIEGTGFVNGNVTFHTTNVLWTLKNRTLVSDKEVRVDAKPEKTRKSKKGGKDFNETGDLVVTVDSSDPETFEVEFEPEDP
jgi:hypothetical protein